MCFKGIICVSQNQGNVWCFGNAEKLNFNSAPPTNGTCSFNGTYNASSGSNEGVASICDQNGALLFYTDGQTVYNSSDAVMTNGTGLLGDVSSTQSGIIVPKPGSTTQYFIFTVDAWGGPDLIKYSIVDMSTSAGQVISTKKNLSMPYSLSTPAHFAEKITAIPKAGGIGYWLIAHVAQETTGTNGTFIVWSIGCGSSYDGISEMLVSGQRQSIGSPCVYSGSINDGNTLGYMKISPDSKKLAYASLGLNIIEVFDFNNTTGIISNPKTINNTSYGAFRPYGIEFSPNNQYLYAADFYSPIIYQYNVNATNINATGSFYSINYTPTGLNTNGSWGYYAHGALQTAKDGNIYIALPGRDHLAKISTPNTFPLSLSMFTESAITFNTGSYCTLGLPNIVSSFVGNALINITGEPCAYNMSYAGSSNIPGATYSWNFGDGQTSTLQNPTHSYSNAGTYIITLTVTDPVSGCSTSVQQSVITTGCGCLAATDSHYYKYLSQTTISTNTVWDDKIYIGDNVIVTVDNGATLDITNVDVVFGHGAGINFTNGAVIRANNSVFRPCNINEVWRGLDFYTTNSSNPSGIINECTFKNAKTSIEAYSSNTTKMPLDLRITNNLFANCQRGIAFSTISFNRSISGNTYMIDNKNLPYNTVSSQLNNSADFYGIYTDGSVFYDLISQNDFIFTSNASINNNRVCGIFSNNNKSLSISDNKFTDFSLGIYGNSDSDISVENNMFTWTHYFNMAAAPGNKAQILVNYALNALIKGNKIYNSNIMNSNTSTLPNLTTANIGISSNGSKYVTVSQNEVNGCEIGMLFNGASGQPNQYLFITENTINKSWYFGIYTSCYNDIDISCNKIDMELNSVKDATGIVYNNTLLSGGKLSNYYVNANDVGIRSNCILNSKTGIYCYNQNNTVSVPLPKVYNNFVYNYRQYGFENNGYSAIATTSPREVYHNTFISNNSASGTVDINTDASHIITLEANYGIQNSNSNVNMLLSNTQASSASCAMQVGTFQNNITNYNGAQLCNYYFTGVNSNTWTPIAKMIPMNLETQSDSTNNFNDGINYQDPIHTLGGSIVNYKDQLFIVYPNPAKDKINIRYNVEEANNAYIEFIDVQGRVIKTQGLSYEMTTVDVDINDLPIGFYILKMTNSDKSTYYSKLIKN